MSETIRVQLSMFDVHKHTSEVLFKLGNKCGAD